ncbi:MAG TPA: HAD hydrolase-like protein [Elusimicrobiales bacterium]|nr:HAD hydrolase-like protein [Elusimicrobiales bacterium]
MKIVLFDIDGTLVKAGGAGSRALDKAVKELYGAEGVCARVSWQGCTDTENFALVYRYATGKKPTARQFRALELKYLSLLPAEVERSRKTGDYRKLAGVEKLLAELSRRKDVMIGLGTGNLKTGALIKLAPSGMLKYFAFGGYGCDSAVRSELLKKAVERAEKLAGAVIRPGEVYVIGDTHRDVEAAKAAGYHCAAVLDGFGDENAVLRSGAELVTRNFSDLEPWLVWLGLENDPKGVRRGTYVCPDSPIEHAHFGRTGMDLKAIDDGLIKLRKLKSGRKGRS